MLALFLSAAGVYGLLSFAVNQRRREIAIRASLVVGLIGAIAATRLLIAMLYGMQPYDPLALLTACAAIAAMAIAATWLPTRRAVSVDPNIVPRDI